jgi:NRAMP (natural resistance-associated macrophage protein)-like metal ion transporter
VNLSRFRFIAFFAVFGPGFITANVDNDPGGILTYSQAGAKFGSALLWTLIPTTIALIVVQEMAARTGAVTGKELHDLIREEFGIRATFFVSFVFGLADLGNIVAEFADITVRDAKVKHIKEYIDTQALARASEMPASPRP